MGGGGAKAPFDYSSNRFRTVNKPARQQPAKNPNYNYHKREKIAVTNRRKKNDVCPAEYRQPANESRMKRQIRPSRFFPASGQTRMPERVQNKPKATRPIDGAKFNQFEFSPAEGMRKRPLLFLGNLRSRLVLAVPR